MIGILVLGHGRLPTGITSALELFYGDLEAYDSLDFLEGQSLDDYDALLKEKVDNLKQASSGGLIVFADLFGGTPFNRIMIATEKDSEVDVIVPLGLPMLMEAMNSRLAVDGDESGRKEVIARVEAAYQAGFVDAKKLLEK